MRLLVVAAALLMTSSCMSLGPMREAAVGLPGYQAGATVPFGCPGFAVAREYTADGGAHGITCATRDRAWAIPNGEALRSEGDVQKPFDVMSEVHDVLQKGGSWLTASFSKLKFFQSAQPT